MRALVAVASVSLILLLGAASSSADVTRPTWLRVTYWEDGSTAVPTKTWTLHCKPARGTLPRPAHACRKLAAGGAKLFAPLRPDVACTQIYGGPQRAHVVGRVHGRRVASTFTRSDGCEIARWNALAPWLLPPGGTQR